MVRRERAAKPRPSSTRTTSKQEPGIMRIPARRLRDPPAGPRAGKRPLAPDRGSRLRASRRRPDLDPSAGGGGRMPDQPLRIPAQWRQYAPRRTGQEAPEVMTEGSDPAFSRLESGYDPADPVDRAIPVTRSAVFPEHGLMPGRDQRIRGHRPEQVLPLGEVDEPRRSRSSPAQPSGCASWHQPAAISRDDRAHAARRSSRSGRHCHGPHDRGGPRRVRGDGQEVMRYGKPVYER